MKIYTHTDKLGRELAVNDTVIYSSFYGGLTIGRVDVVNRVRVRLSRLTDRHLISGPEDINPRDVVKVDSKEIEFYLLKGGK